MLIVCDFYDLLANLCSALPPGFFFVMKRKEFNFLGLKSSWKDPKERDENGMQLCIYCLE